MLLGTTRYVRFAFLQGMAPLPGALAAERTLAEAARRALVAVGLSAWAGELAGNLPYGLRRHVEIARALAAGPRLLLLDEPSAGMDAAETAELGSLISRLVDRLGITVLLVEHDMSMVRPFADVVHVLHQGRLLASGAPDEVLARDEVRLVYLGRTPEGRDPGHRCLSCPSSSCTACGRTTARCGRSAASTSSSGRAPPSRCSVATAPGRRPRCGWRRPWSRPGRGSITFDGQAINGSMTEELVGRGLAHVPEGRAIFDHLSVAENLELGAHSLRLSRRSRPGPHRRGARVLPAAGRPARPAGRHPVRR